MRRIALALGAILAVTLAARLLITAGGGGIVLPAFPTDWAVERHPDNPIIDVADNPNETTEQYVPTMVRLSDGTILGFTKGAESVWAHISTDDGETFPPEDWVEVLTPTGSGWRSHFIIEPTATFDPDTGTIHLYAKGRASGSNTWAWGHFTADESDPTNFTEDPANPILTSATVSTALGGGTISDLAISDVVKIGGVFRFYGYAAHNSRYKLIQATGSTWNNPSGVEVIHTAANDNEVAGNPSVIRVSGGFAMFWTIGGPQPDPRWIRVATSRNASTWDFSDTTNVISPTGTGWEEDEAYAGSFLKDGIGPDPYLIGGKILFYYSGLEDTIANSGLIYMEPS